MSTKECARFIIPMALVMFVSACISNGDFPPDLGPGPSHLVRICSARGAPDGKPLLEPEYLRAMDDWKAEHPDRQFTAEVMRDLKGPQGEQAYFRFLSLCRFEEKTD